MILTVGVEFNGLKYSQEFYLCRNRHITLLLMLKWNFDLEDKLYGKWTLTEVGVEVDWGNRLSLFFRFPYILGHYGWAIHLGHQQCFCYSLQVEVLGKSNSYFLQLCSRILTMSIWLWAYSNSFAYMGV